MMRMLALLLCLVAVPAAAAVDPDEIFDDPALEERARGLFKDLRCVVCRNEAIDESNADLARDMRLMVREQLAAGATDEEAMNFMVERYGEYVLLRPTTEGVNLVLWAAAPAMFVVALAGAVLYLRRRRSASDSLSAELSPEEEARLRELTRD